MIDWLAVQESYTSFSGRIPLDQATVLHNYEIPELSAEPQAEPWSKPSSGYKWYDASTFAAGSYGGSGNGGGNPGGSIGSASFAFNMPQRIETGTPQQMTLTITGLAPNTTYDGLQMGAYLTGGTQIGRFAGAGAGLPSGYGYSASFAVTSDAGGQAAMIINYILNPSAGGDFNLRLRQNSTNLFTQTKTIGGSGNLLTVPIAVIP